MPHYIFRVSMQHPTFLLPSLQAVADLYEFPLRYVSEDCYRGILIVDLEKDEDAEKFLERGTMVMSVTRLWAEGASYDEVHAALKADLSVFEPYKGKTFKFDMESTNHKTTGTRQRQVIDSFSYCGLDGVDMKNPQVEFVIFEDYDVFVCHTLDHRLKRDGQFRRVYFGRRLGFSRARPLVIKHDVKTRAFYGNTSMDSEMGFLMAGQGLPAPGKIVYDPFVGTGSLLYAAAHWGAYVFGSDIDGRQMRGKQKGKNVVPGMLRSAEQYGVKDQFLDLFTFDITQNPLRRGGWIDAIVTDPPYGVRAGAKRLGKRPTSKRPLRDEPCMLENGVYSHESPDYHPPSRPYEMINLTLDLIHLARYLLVPKGRLVFMLPTMTEDWNGDIDLPPVEGMRELKIDGGSVQDFHGWGRRLITMEKTATDTGPRPLFQDHREEYDLAKGRIPGHHDFGQRYFERLVNKDRTSSDDEPHLTTSAS